METIENQINKNIENFSCLACDFSCSKKGDYNRHIKTKKHLEKEIHKITSNYILPEFVCECGKKYTGFLKHTKLCEFDLCDSNTKLEPIENIFMCNICNKKYYSNNGLWKHKKKCISPPSTKNTTDIINVVNLCIETIHKNQEFQIKMFNMMKEYENKKI